MNTIIVMGRLVRDVELKNASTTIASGCIAVPRKYKREGQPDSDFFNFTAFGKTAEFISKYFSKGSKMLLSGNLQNDTYEKDGVKHTIAKIMVDNVEFCESAKENTEKSDGFMSIPDGTSDEIPFA